MLNRYLKINGVCLFLWIFTAMQAHAQNKNTARYWHETVALNNPNSFAMELPQQYRTVVPDLAALKQILQQAPAEFTPAAAQTENLPLLALPLPQGGQLLFYIVEAPLMEPQLAAMHPGIKTYRGVAVEQPHITMRLTLTERGVYAMALTSEGLLALEPMPGSFIPATCLVYFDNRIPDTGFLCGVTDDRHRPLPGNDYRGACGGNGGTLQTYRIAIAATGELTTQYGGTTGATDFIVASLSGITLIFERELSVRLTLIAGNSSLIFSNPATDPFDPSSASLPNNAQSGIATVLNNSQYDIGHVFNYSGSGNSGIAGLGVVCENGSKGKGWSSIFNLPLSRWVLLVAHEIGHQFGATHSFYGTESACSQRSTAGAYEPGSGTTIMSYQGICGTQNVGLSKDDYFHAVSLQQMLSYIGSGATCSANAATGNTPPAANANPTGTAYTIPIQTPFELTGAATDANGDALTYCWEEFDTDGSAGGPPNSAATSATAPLFRSFLPVTTPTRLFPQLSDILNNTQTIGEILPAVARTMNFRLTVRDNNAAGGAFDCDATSVTVSAASGPFSITSQNSATTWTANGSNTATVTWNVANTTAAPVSCANVNILFSTDGGLTFPYTLVANTPNNGTHTFTIPSYPTAAGRVKVAASGNIFFDINNAVITLNSACAANGAAITPANPVSATAGAPALDLNLQPAYGSAIANFSGSITTGDPESFLAANNGSGSCVSFGGNPNRYDAYSFMVNTAGNYTFTRTSGASGIVLHCYTGNFNANNPCANWLGSSFNSATTINSSSLTLSLSTNIVYTFVVSGFSGSNPVLPASYTIGFTPPAGGGLYNGTPPPPAGYAYTYIMVNNNTNIIAGVNGSSDLSNAIQFPPATYWVYGLSYQTSSLPNTNVLIGTTLQNLQSNLALLVYCGSLSTNFVTVEVQPVSCVPPAAPAISPPPVTEVCSNTVTLTASVIPGGFSGYGYQWYRNGIIIGGATSQSYLAEAGGTYTVLLTDGSCPSAQSGAVMLTQTPPAAPVISPPTVTLCQGNTAMLTATAIGVQYPNHVYRWYKDGVLLAGQTTQSIMASQSGNYTVQAYFTDNCASPVSAAVVVTVIPVTGIPNAQNFSAAVPPSGWVITNPDAATTWTSQTSTCNGASAAMNNFVYNAPGQQDFLNSPLYDLTAVASALLNFDVAYARYDATFFDALQVQISTDCGQNYTTIYNKSGSILATAPDITAAFTPSDCSQWRTETIDLTPYAGNTVLLRFVAINGFGNTLFLDNINLNSSAPPTGVKIEAKVWLEGAFNNANNNMNTYLRQNNLLPANQPYNRPPWNYSGSETAPSIPANVTDWVLLEALDGLQNVVARQAALLRNDGILLSPDGSVGVTFTSGVSAGNSYLLRIRHRNHIALQSSAGIVIPNTNNPYDFSAAGNVQGGATQVAAVGAGMNAMNAADITANGIVNYADFNAIFTQNGLGNVYNDADCNLDGGIDSSDFSLYTQRTGAIGIAVIRY
ncbi:hypothetical protein C7N43_13435 [Sphingobacteriales bacterium UPWRP_1]|nr:hypothetical protein B6N25_03565 [Sphingobacteriales bacterium TSM_CSS]PSJ76528.1 hypothetical protein C7N43_13435 [Sphingobacteriales bacterium UPWRP_1]